jgi:carbonic anhydrase
MDARLNVERILGLAEGDAHVIRNAGALITEDVLRSLEASRALGSEEVVVMLHTDCGARDGDLDQAAREAAHAIANGGAPFAGGVRAYVYEVDTRELREIV